MLIELYTFATSILGAAMRLVRLDHEEAQLILAQLQPLMIRVVQDDHEEAQLILAQLRPLMVRVVQENIDKGLQEMRAFAPLIDIMGAVHERARVRLFIS